MGVVSIQEDILTRYFEAIFMRSGQPTASAGLIGSHTGTSPAVAGVKKAEEKVRVGRWSFFKLLRPRLAARYGHEAHQFGQSGKYRNASGGWVNVATEVSHAVNGTKISRVDSPLPEPARSRHDTHFVVLNETILSAAQRLQERGLRPVTINFEYGKASGGRFREGGQRFQEEFLARSSALSQCLDTVRHNNPPSPTKSSVLYSPDVPVFRADDGTPLDRTFPLSILTIPAILPDKRSLDPILASRIRNVLSVGIAHGHDSLVLGAWGCGNSSSDQIQVARLFRDAIDKDFPGAYKIVTLAVVDWQAQRRRTAPFESVFLR